MGPELGLDLSEHATPPPTPSEQQPPAHAPEQVAANEQPASQSPEKQQALDSLVRETANFLETEAGQEQYLTQALQQLEAAARSNPALGNAVGELAGVATELFTTSQKYQEVLIALHNGGLTAKESGVVGELQTQRANLLAKARQLENWTDEIFNQIRSYLQDESEAEAFQGLANTAHEIARVALLGEQILPALEMLLVQ